MKKSDYYVFRLPYSSNQNWTEDPDEVELTVTHDFSVKVKEAANFLSSSGFNEVILWGGAEYSFFRKTTNEGMVGFNPEYTVELCEARIDAKGYVSFVFLFKNDDCQGWAGEIAF